MKNATSVIESSDDTAGALNLYSDIAELDASSPSSCAGRSTWSNSGSSSPSNRSEDDKMNKTDAEVFESAAQLKAKRKTHFNQKVSVHSIPSRRELSPMFADLWYTGRECDRFKREAYFEMKNYIERNHCSVKQAMLDLHQPEEEESAMDEEITLNTLYSAFDKWANDHFNFTLPRLEDKSSFNDKLKQRKQDGCDVFPIATTAECNRSVL